MTITDIADQSLDRSQRRLLRRIYNGLTVPIVVDGKSFLTYKEASRYLLPLPREARDKAITEMKNSFAGRSGMED